MNGHTILTTLNQELKRIFDQRKFFYFSSGLWKLPDHLDGRGFLPLAIRKIHLHSADLILLIKLIMFLKFSKF